MFSSGNVETLGLDIIQDTAFGNKWVLEVSKTQDYESTFKKYTAEITVQGSSTRGIMDIEVRNLNDNAPFFDLANVGCENVEVRN